MNCFGTNENMVIFPSGSKTKIDCPGEDQQLVTALLYVFQDLVPNGSKRFALLSAVPDLGEPIWGARLVPRDNSDRCASWGGTKE
jgi:hypothetical protein